MDQITALSTWRSSLDQIESEDVASTNHASIIDEFLNLFLHMSPQTAPRLQKELESCTKRSERILGQLFDTIDLSDKNLLCSLLKCVHAFGYFRLTQITYHIDQTIREESSSIYSPPIEKVKWYDMEPLLPPAGTIGWKGIITSYLVREEPDLSQTCLQLLSQKLHFYSIISQLDRFRVCSKLIKRNGGRVAEELFKLIRDVACEDERMIGLDEYTYNILKPFVNQEQQAIIIDAIVQDLFKPFLTQRHVAEEEIEKLYQLINGCIMNESSSQGVFISKLLEHLKCNMIRMKRRHSVEPVPENGNTTWKTLIDNINNGDKLQTVLSLVDQVQVSSKHLQTNYISYWLQIIGRILPKKTLTATNSLKILGACSFLVVKATSLSIDNLSMELTQTLAQTIECTTQIRLDKLFSSCNPTFLIELTTKVIENCGNSNSESNLPLVDFYKSYLNRYLKCCTLRVARLEPEDLVSFVTVICDKSICDGWSYMLQNICIEEISRCIDDYKNRISNKIMDVYSKCTRLCAKRLYKFIKRNSSIKTDTRTEYVDDAETSEIGDHNENLVNDEKRALATSSLVSILSIAIESKDQEILDYYGNLLLKLYKVVGSSFEDAVRSVRDGKGQPLSPLDRYLPKLTLLYIEHRELVSPYVQRDLIEDLSNIIVQSEISMIHINGVESESKTCRKTVYLQLKAKMETLKNQATNSSIDMYQTIINKQYSAVTDQYLGSFNETIKEDSSCTHGYRQRLDIVEVICSTIAEQSSPEVRADLLEKTVTWLELIDPLDHPRFIYILSLLHCLIPKNCRAIKLKLSPGDPFLNALPRISCALIRLCKSVELGPSIHAHKNSGSHKSNRGIQCCTYATCIRIYTAIFRNYSPRVVSAYMTDAMQICISANLIQYAKYSSRLHKFFIQLASSIADLLKSICLDRKEDEIVRSSLPIFLTVFSHLIRCIIMASDRQKLETLPRHRLNGCADSYDLETKDIRECLSGTLRDDYEKKLGLLARDIGKCLKQISELKVKFVDHAPHLISTYIKDIQRASCPDHIKLHLNEGLFRVFNLVDAHQKDRKGEILEAGVQRNTTAGRASGSLFEMIHARLDQASREIFKDMHDNHTKFHRYVGRC